MDAIDRMFAEFELVYHNQYNKAYPNTEKLIYAKKIWFSNLRDVLPSHITQACHRAIRESEFLPTVKGILKFCGPSDSELGITDVHSAYLEACRAPQPKAEYNWSHPAVYHAGKGSDWFYLANTTEQQAFPVFKRHYEAIIQRLRDGEKLSLPTPIALPETISKPLSQDEQRERMRAMRKDLDI
ncbi:MAG: replication protein P [Spongiibacteraceae bacterium]